MGTPDNRKYIPVSVQDIPELTKILSSSNLAEGPVILASVVKNGGEVYGLSLALPPPLQHLGAKRVFALVATDMGAYYLELTRYDGYSDNRLFYGAVGPSKFVLKRLYEEGKRVVTVLKLVPR